jgi:hypothetical protein
MLVIDQDLTRRTGAIWRARVTRCLRQIRAEQMLQTATAGLSTDSRAQS